MWQTECIISTLNVDVTNKIRIILQIQTILQKILQTILCDE